MRKGLFVLLIPLILAGLDLPAQNPYIQHYTTLDGLPSNVVYQVYQDSKKFLWFATDAGVARFDGSRFTYYRKQNGLSSNDIVKIKEDSKGRIWFFNLNASMDFFYQNEIYNSRSAAFLDSLRPREFFKDFFEDTDGTLYWYNNKDPEIYILDTLDHVKIYPLPSMIYKGEFDPFASEGMVIRYMDRPGGKDFHLWTIPGMLKLDILTGEIVKIGSDDIITKAFRIAPCEMYIQSLVYENESGWHSLIHKYNCNFHKDLSVSSIDLGADFVSNIIRDKDQNLWISTFDKGLFCYKNNRMILHQNINEAQWIMQDHEGNIWVGSLKDGAYKISPYILKHFHYDKGFFSNAGVLVLSPDLHNGVWCANSSSVYLVRNRHVLSTNLGVPGSSFNQVIQVDENKLIVGEINLRHFALENIKVSAVSGKMMYDKISRSIYAYKKIVSNSTRSEISSFEAYGLSFLDPENLFIVNNKRYVNERIYNIYYNVEDNLVINTKENSIYKDGVLMRYPELSTLNNKTITDHINLTDGNEILNVEGDSVFFFDGSKLYNLTQAFITSPDLQIKHLEYRAPTLIIGTARNIFLCDHPERVMLNEPILLKPVDLSFRNIHDIMVYKDSLYVASDDGLTVMPFESIKNTTSFLPIPYVKSFRINDEEAYIQDSCLYILGNKRLHIEYSSINYSFCPVIYSYRMEGVDKNWSITSSADVVYQHLYRGKYHFHIRVRTTTTDWSAPAEYHIQVNATFWQHPLFYVLLAVIITGIAVLIILNRKNNQLKQREIEHQLLMLEQKALQSMMNPHFIFNTLGSIQNYLLQSKPGDAGLYLSQFARLVRQNLNAINEAVINLEEEADRLKNYMDLEKLRLEGKFDYHIQMDEGLESEDIQIPSMIIQPFVENAIWHGVSHLEGKGMIWVFFRKHSENSLEIIIEDNGIGIQNSEKYSVKGEKHLKLSMAMTRKRIELLGKKFKTGTALTIKEKEPGSPNPGTVVTILLPYSFEETS